MPRRSSNNGDGKPIRTVAIRRDRLLACIEDDPRYQGDVQKFIDCKELPICPATAAKALLGHGIHRRKAEIIAAHFGKPADYFIDHAPQRDEAVKHASNELRRILMRLIASGELAQITKSENGLYLKTNLFSAALTLATHPSLYGYLIDDAVARLACELLARDGWAIKSDTGEDVYHVNPFTRRDLTDVIEHRVGVEMIQVRAAIRKMDDIPGFAAALRLRHVEYCLNCETHVAQGLGFRDADHRFHAVISNVPEIKDSIAQAVQSADQVYMQWRSLLKYRHGSGKPQYVAEIEQFNQGQLSDLQAICLEFERSHPSPRKIEEILRLHVTRQCGLLDRCAAIVDDIRGDGDPDGLAAALS
jgi:hypothetical protein